MRILWLAAVAALAAMPAQAVTEADFQANTTGQFVALCGADPREPMGVAAVNFCHGFAVGAVRLQQTYHAASRNTRLFCLPDPPPAREQAIAAFVAWAKADQKRLDMKPADAMFAYLGTEYPCKRGR